MRQLTASQPMRLVCAASILFLSATITAQAQEFTPITLTPAQEKAVRETVASGLKDPDAARFSKIVAGRNAKGAIKVCGMVNAKNSYGAYVGAMPFVGGFRNDSFILVAGPAPDDTVATFVLALSGWHHYAMASHGEDRCT